MNVRLGGVQHYVSEAFKLVRLAMHSTCRAHPVEQMALDYGMGFDGLRACLKAKGVAIHGYGPRASDRSGSGLSNRPIRAVSQRILRWH